MTPAAPSAFAAPAEQSARAVARAERAAPAAFLAAATQAVPEEAGSTTLAQLCVVTAEWQSESGPRLMGSQVSTPGPEVVPILRVARV